MQKKKIITYQIYGYELSKNLLPNKATIHNVSNYNPQQNIFNSLKITKTTYKLP